MARERKAMVQYSPRRRGTDQLSVLAIEHYQRVVDEMDGGQPRTRTGVAARHRKSTRFLLPARLPRHELSIYRRLWGDGDRPRALQHVGKRNCGIAAHARPVGDADCAPDHGKDLGDTMLDAPGLPPIVLHR